jgi:hypothetical protein
MLTRRGPSAGGSAVRAKLRHRLPGQARQGRRKERKKKSDAKRRQTQLVFCRGSGHGRAWSARRTPIGVSPRRLAKGTLVVFGSASGQASWEVAGRFRNPVTAAPYTPCDGQMPMPACCKRKSPNLKSACRAGDHRSVSYHRKTERHSGSRGKLSRSRAHFFRTRRRLQSYYSQSTGWFLTFLVLMAYGGPHRGGIMIVPAILMSLVVISLMLLGFWTVAN